MVMFNHDTYFLNHGISLHKKICSCEEAIPYVQASLRFKKCMLSNTKSVTCRGLPKGVSWLHYSFSYYLLMILILPAHMIFLHADNVNALTLLKPRGHRGACVFQITVTECRVGSGRIQSNF